MIEQTFLSAQVIQSVVNSNKLEYTSASHVFEQLRILGNSGMSGTSQNFIELLPSAHSFSRN